MATRGWNSAAGGISVVTIASMAWFGCGAATATTSARRMSKPVDPTPLASARRCTIGGGEQHVAPPMPGGSITLSPDGRFAAAVDGDNDRVAILAIEGTTARVAQTIAVGHGPVQAAFGSDDRIFVTERRDRRASVYDARNGRRLCSAEAGVDPVGIALAPDQRTVLVTSGLDHRLTAIDTDDFTTRYEVSVPREPRGVTVTADGSRAFLTHVAGDPLSMVDLTPGASKRMVSIPHAPIRGDNAQSDTRPPFEPRGVTPERDREAERENAEFMLEDERPARVAIVRAFASQAWNAVIDEANARVIVPFMVSRTGNHHLFDPLDGDGAPSNDSYGGSGEFDREKVSFAFGAFDIQSETWTDVQFPVTGSDDVDAHLPVRLPSAAVIGPDGEVIVSSMGTHVLARLDSNAPLTAHSVPTVAAPCGMAMRDDGLLLVYSQFEHAVEVRRIGVSSSTGAMRAPLLVDRRGAAITQSPAPPVEYVDRVSTGADSLDPVVALGRRLFHDASDTRISQDGLACAGCHPDGRDDGLVWFLSEGPRQTPTLGGRLIHPFNWTGTGATLEANIRQTIRRLGGTELQHDEVTALATYIATALPVPEREERALTELEAHGRDLFAGTAACDGCHNPDRNFTDGTRHGFPGARFPEATRRYDTPSLTHVASTAPYFHDGRFASLRDVLTSHRHRMGHADLLASDDVDALEAYLQTL